MSDDKSHCFDPELLGRPANYTGVWEACWPNGSLKHRCNLVDGVEVGQQVSFWEDGTLASVRWHDSLGRPRGTTVTFYPDGEKDTEEVQDDDQPRPGTFVCRCFDGNGDVFLRTTYRDFEQVDSWTRPKEQSEEDIETDKLIDKAVEEAIRNLEREIKLDDKDEDDEE